MQSLEPASDQAVSRLSTCTAWNQLLIRQVSKLSVCIVFYTTLSGG